VAVLAQRVQQVTADETGAPGEKDFHEGTTLASLLGQAPFPERHRA